MSVDQAHAELSDALSAWREVSAQRDLAIQRARAAFEPAVTAARSRVVKARNAVAKTRKTEGHERLALSERDAALFRTRIEARVEFEAVTGCWLWWGGTDRDGYGRINAWGGSAGAHRLSYLAFVGPVPPRMMVCHRCDTPACVNPAHLFLGSPRDNVRDMTLKGRGRMTLPPGEKHPNCKVSDAAVRRIRTDTRDTTMIAAEFGLTPAYVRQIRRGANRCDA